MVGVNDQVTVGLVRTLEIHRAARAVVRAGAAAVSAAGGDVGQGKRIKRGAALGQAYGNPASASASAGIEVFADAAIGRDGAVARKGRDRQVDGPAGPAPARCIGRRPVALGRDQAVVGQRAAD